MAALVLASGCTCLVYMPDAGSPDAGPADAGSPDAGPPDAGPLDAGPTDGGRGDAGTLPDAGTLRCVEVFCVGDTSCDVGDGICRCNGALCGAGQTCTCPAGSPGCQPSERICDVSSRCDAVTCTGGATCDTADGLCKCTGAGGPVCTDVQQCGAARQAQCVGGCPFGCDRGLSCDADDGACKCGGHAGNACAAEEICVSTANQYACRLPCAPGGACPAGQYCFIDTQPSLGVAYCAFPSGLLGEGAPCTRSTQCFDGHPLHCAGLSAMQPLGTCREACSPGGSPCAAGRRCAALADVPDAGLCVP